MDITKYLNNKDVQLSNEDINFEKLEKDIRKGYVLADEVDKAREEAKKEGVSKYTELETKYNSLDKSFNDLQAKNVELNNGISSLKLQNEMVLQGFKPEQFDEVSKLRTTLFADEEDNSKAISGIKEKFGATYFPKEQTQINTSSIPDEDRFKQQATPPKQEIKITRKTSVKDLFK
jgi:hypothetical protein